MRVPSTFAKLLLLSLYAPCGVLGAPAAIVDVKLTTGTFRGVSTPGVADKFLGIPFALQPVGSLRFKAPVPITEKSCAVKDASVFGNACPQSPNTDLGAPIGEDCLHLNVCIPFVADDVYGSYRGVDLASARVEGECETSRAVLDSCAWWFLEIGR
jgi:hypothetical protein